MSHHVNTFSIYQIEKIILSTQVYTDRFVSACLNSWTNFKYAYNFYLFRSYWNKTYIDILCICCFIQKIVLKMQKSMRNSGYILTNPWPLSEPLFTNFNDVSI